MAIEVFWALGNQTRRAIVNRLRMGPKSVGDIAESMKVSRPAVSQGLKILLRAELVKRKLVGRRVFYWLDRRGVERALTFLEGLENVIERYGQKGPGEGDR